MFRNWYLAWLTVWFIGAVTYTAVFLVAVFGQGAAPGGARPASDPLVLLGLYGLPVFGTLLAGLSLGWGLSKLRKLPWRSRGRSAEPAA